MGGGGGDVSLVFSHVCLQAVVWTPRTCRIAIARRHLPSTRRVLSGPFDPSPSTSSHRQLSTPKRPATLSLFKNYSDLKGLKWSPVGCGNCSVIYVCIYIIFHLTLRPQMILHKTVNKISTQLFT